MDFIFQLLLVILLVFLNGFFVASEFALVGVRRTRIDELVNKGNAAAKLVQKALDNLDSYISATQLGITLASLGLGWIGEPAIARFLEPSLANYLSNTVAFITAHTLAIIFAFSFITFLHIVLGELAPKTVALQRAEATSLFVIIPLMAFATLFKPFIWFLNGAGSLVIRLVGLRPPSMRELVHSEEEIKMLLSQSEEKGVIPKDEAEMVYKVFKLGDTSVKKIMIPKAKIINFNLKTSLEEAIEVIRKHPHSRFPIFDNSVKKIIGFVHVKDIYQAALSSKDKKFSEIKIVRHIIKIPENKKVDDVLVEMRRNRIHIAIVSNKSGKTVGLITMEDIIESLVGEIKDEFESLQ